MQRDLCGWKSILFKYILVFNLHLSCRFHLPYDLKGYVQIFGNVNHPSTSYKIFGIASLSAFNIILPGTSLLKQKRRFESNYTTTGVDNVRGIIDLLNTDFASFLITSTKSYDCMKCSHFQNYALRSLFFNETKFTGKFMESNAYSAGRESYGAVPPSNWNHRYCEPQSETSTISNRRDCPSSAFGNVCEGGKKVWQAKPTFYKSRIRANFGCERLRRHHSPNGSLFRYPCGLWKRVAARGVTTTAAAFGVAAASATIGRLDIPSMDMNIAALKSSMDDVRLSFTFSLFYIA